MGYFIECVSLGARLALNKQPYSVNHFQQLKIVAIYQYSELVVFVPFLKHSPDEMGILSEGKLIDYKVINLLVESSC